MITSFERMVAWRYLRAKKAEGFVSVIAGFSFTGIMLGVATLIIVMAVMNGFREELFSRILGLNGHMNLYGVSGKLYDYEGARAQLLSLEGVESAVPLIDGQALFSKNGQAAGVMVRGIDALDFSARPLIQNAVQDGDLLSFNGRRVAIGNVLARKMNLRVGDEILLTSPEAKSTPFGSMPRQRSYEIALIFDVGMYEYNSGFVFMPLEAAQIFFRQKDTVSTIEVFLSDPAQLDQMRTKIEEIMGAYAAIYDWRDSNKSFFDALQVERNVMFLILTLIILVAAFNIISSMIMLVKDKSHDIAIMRTMGASSGSMMRVFMLTGASIGFLGTFAGAALGIGFAANIDLIRLWLESLTGWNLWEAELRWLSEVPAEINPKEVVAVILMAFTLSILATLYPAFRAARLSPVEALRYE